MKRTFEPIFAALAVLFGLTLLTASVHAQDEGNTFVYTNNNPAGSNSVSAFAVGPGGNLTPVTGSPFPTGGMGDGLGGLEASYRVITTRNFLALAAGTDPAAERQSRLP